MPDQTSPQAEGPNSSSPPEDITQLLTAAELAALRSGFSPEEVVGPSRQTIVGAFPPVADFTDAFLSYFFSEGLPPAGNKPVSSLTPRERERILITVLALRLGGNGRLFAIHLYWGLMTGMSVREIADQLFLLCVYAGQPVNTAAMATFRTLLLKLKERVASNQVQASSILAATAQWFPVS